MSITVPLIGGGKNIKSGEIMREFEKTPDGGRLNIRGAGKYVLIPVCEADRKEELICEVDGEIIWRFKVPYLESADKILYYGAINTGCENITVSGDFTDTFFAAVKASDQIPEAADTHPAVHFAARNGWINDPNGLIFHDGVYHMYFQFNPVDTVWENMSWGHAVSRDLLHWTQTDDAMYPDGDGTIFSGSAIENKGSCLSLPENALLLFYTSAGGTSPWSKDKPFTQKIAYSLDGGNTFTKIKEPALNCIAKENRDPKIYWYEPRKLYYMVLYLENDEFAILNSTNLRNFTVTQHLYMEGSGECPDLRRLPCDDGSEQWLFMQADGRYYLGDFDGSRFEIKSGLQRAYKSELPYAAQTMNQPEERVILIPWLRTRNSGCAYTGMMGLARELSLVRRDGQYKLRLKPVREYFSARRETDNPVYSFAQNRALEIELNLGNSSSAEVLIGQLTVAYDKEQGTLRIGEDEFFFEKELDGLHILIDKGILEITSPDYLYLFTAEVSESLQEGEVKVGNQSLGNGVEAVLYEI